MVLLWTSGSMSEIELRMIRLVVYLDRQIHVAIDCLVHFHVLENFPDLKASY